MIAVPRSFLRRLWLAGAIVSLFAATAFADWFEKAVPAPPFPEGDFRQAWQFDFETGAAWHVTGPASRLNYMVMPQIISLRTPPVMHRTWLGGDLIMRSRFSFIAEPILQGPETHFFGVTASGMLEWWDPTGTGSAFFSSGGGFGGLNSKGYEVSGAQGQDFNFTWFAYGGTRWRFAETMSVSLGLYFQHISNHGLDKVNPGFNVLGPMVGVSWKF